MKAVKLFLRILIGLFCLLLDFYALLWVECFFFEKYDNPLRYMGVIYLPYICIYVAVFIYLLVVTVKWIARKARYQIFFVFLLAVLGAFTLVYELGQKVNSSVDITRSENSVLYGSCEQNSDEMLPWEAEVFDV